MSIEYVGQYWTVAQRQVYSEPVNSKTIEHNFIAK